MPLTMEEVEHIAQLARLDLSTEQKMLYLQQLSAILDHIAALRQLDTTSVPPTAGGGLDRMDLRTDQPAEGLSTKAILRNAAESQDDQFKIPPVFE